MGYIYKHYNNMKTTNKQTANKMGKSNTSSKKDIKTDMPLSEKDEVKAAEKRTRKGLKDQ